MLDTKKIKEEGITLLGEFSRGLEKVPETVATHYLMDLKNVLRADGEPLPKTDFPGKLKKLAPRCDEGYVVAEKGV
ncbi:MAG: Asp-tRNA(Asn) amidotransferase GatCAB subunit C [Candidatus Altiarchaeota archaeon]|nr:Asp-tRNA(Asn) amidotransferase GatCAB subunit C [Candidatus Altiarchaeota archaeon]